MYDTAIKEALSSSVYVKYPIILMSNIVKPRYHKTKYNKVLTGPSRNSSVFITEKLSCLLNNNNNNNNYNSNHT